MDKITDGGKANVLAEQKKTVKRAAKDYLYTSLLFLFLSVIVLIVALTLDDKAHASGILYGVFPCLTVIVAVFLIFSIRRFCTVRAFNRIKSRSEETVCIDCKKIRFIRHPVSRFLINLIGVALIDVNRKKYIYILPRPTCYDKDVRDDLRSKCVGKTVEMTCYKDTRAVKFFKYIDISGWEFMPSR